MDTLSAAATQDPEGFLGHPVNAFKLMKRLNTEWGDLESLVLSDTTDGKETGAYIYICKDVLIFNYCYISGLMQDQFTSSCFTDY